MQPGQIKAFTEPASINRAERDISGASVKLLLDGSSVANHLELQKNLLDLFGFDSNSPPLFYPHAKYLQIAEFIRTELYKAYSNDAAYEEIGRGIVKAYFQGSIGQVVKITAEMLGPRVASKTFLKITKQCMPWAIHEYEVGQNYFRYHLRLVPGPPALMRGILKASVEATDAKLLGAKSTVLSEEDVLHEVEWA